MTPQTRPDFTKGVEHPAGGRLLPVAVQDADSGEMLMLAWMNAESFDATMRSGRATYYSRSRESLWRKGDTSGHGQTVREVRIDCDQDAILLRVDQTGAVTVWVKGEPLIAPVGMDWLEKEVLVADPRAGEVFVIDTNGQARAFSNKKR